MEGGDFEECASYRLGEQLRCFAPAMSPFKVERSDDQQTATDSNGSDELARCGCSDCHDAIRWAREAQLDGVGGEADGSQPSLPVASCNGSRSVSDDEQVRVHEGVRGGPRGMVPGKKDSMHTIWPRPHCGQSRNDTPVRR